MSNSAFGNIKREPKKTRLENIIEVGVELLEWERQIVEAMLTDEERKQAEELVAKGHFVEDQDEMVEEGNRIHREAEEQILNKENN